MTDVIVAAMITAVCALVTFGITLRLRYRRTDAVFATAGATAMALTWWLAGTWHPVKSPAFVLIAFAQISTTLLLVGVLGHYRHAPDRNWWFGELGSKLRRVPREERAA